MQYFFRASHGRFQYDDGNLLLAGDDVELANHLLVVAPKPIQTSHHHRVAARKPSHYITILEEASEVSLYTIFRRATMPMDTLQHRLMVPCRGGIGMETWEAIARRIRQLCREQGITPNKLSKISGVPQATVKSILGGESRNPGMVVVKKLCDGFGITLGEFFGTAEFDALSSPRPRGEQT